jgi:hypothetical protein
LESPYTLSIQVNIPAVNIPAVNIPAANTPAASILVAPTQAGAIQGERADL